MAKKENKDLEQKGAEVEAMVPAQLVILTEEESTKWAEFLRDVVYPMEAEADGMYRTIITKQKEALKESERKLKAAVAPLARVKMIIRTAIGSFHTKREQAQAKVQERIDEAARRAGSKGPAQSAPIATRTATVEGVSVRKVWKYEIVDPGLVSRKYLVPDKSSIGKIVRSMGADAQEVVGAGVRIWQESSVAVRS